MNYTFDPAGIPGLFVLAVVALFIFLFNAMAMRRKQLEKLRHLIHVQLLRRGEIAAALLPDCQPPSPQASYSERLQIDEENAKQLSSVSEPDEKVYAEFCELEPQLETALAEYRHLAGRYNEFIARPNFRWLVALLKLKPQEVF